MNKLVRRVYDDTHTPIGDIFVRYRGSLLAVDVFTVDIVTTDGGIIENHLKHIITFDAHSKEKLVGIISQANKLLQEIRKPNLDIGELLDFMGFEENVESEYVKFV